MKPAELFLSHSSADREFATRLAATLREHGVAVWYSHTDMRGAQDWQDEIGAALQRCDWFLIVLSPGATDSMWVKRELTFALQDPRLVDRIVPLLHLDCEPKLLSWVLPGIQMVDFRGEFDAGCRDLLGIWGLGYRPTS